MDIDPRDMPSPEATENISKEIPVPTATETTVQTPVLDNTELETLKIKNLELQKQKEHWREKYERDITNKPIDNFSDDAMSDEGRVLKTQLSTLEAKLAAIEEKTVLEQVTTKYPVLKDKMDEFNEFKSQYPKTDAEKLAKLFLLENGLTDAIKPRIGLEKPSGGSKTPQPKGMAQEDVKRLRIDSPRLYEKMLRSGKLNPDDIN